MFKRSAKIQMEYDNWKQGKNLDEYVLENIIGDFPYILTPNKFPYSLPDGVTHYVFWVNPKKYISIQTAKNIIEIKYGFDHFTIFENSTDEKSVKGVRHYQVLLYL